MNNEHINELKEVGSTDEADNYLKQGWTLVHCFNRSLASKDAEGIVRGAFNQTPGFVLGRHNKERCHLSASA